MLNPSLQISYTLSNIGNTANQFWQYAHQYRILAFHGEMGAGKTTFIHALCDYLNVVDAVSSPTFTLINEYHFTDKNGVDTIIFHIDWYRLRDDEEAINAGMEDALNQKNAFCFIEWAEKAMRILPRPFLKIKIETLGIEERSITCEIIK